jgi:hypothetical protein
VIKRISLLVYALVATLMIVATAAPAFAVSAAERACTESGGTWIDARGGGSCQESEEESGPTTDTGNDPQTSVDTSSENRHGRGVGSGAVTGTTTQHCEYSQAGNLYENKSDPGCPDPEPA